MSKGPRRRQSGLVVADGLVSQNQGQPRDSSLQAGITVIARARINRQVSGSESDRGRTLEIGKQDKMKSGAAAS